MKMNEEKFWLGCFERQRHQRWPRRERQLWLFSLFFGISQPPVGEVYTKSYGQVVIAWNLGHLQGRCSWHQKWWKWCPIFFLTKCRFDFIHFIHFIQAAPGPRRRADTQACVQHACTWHWRKWAVETYQILYRCFGCLGLGHGSPWQAMSEEGTRFCTPVFFFVFLNVSQVLDRWKMGWWESLKATMCTTRQIARPFVAFNGYSTHTFLKLSVNGSARSELVKGLTLPKVPDCCNLTSCLKTLQGWKLFVYDSMRREKMLDSS